MVFIRISSTFILVMNIFFPLFNLKFQLNAFRLVIWKIKQRTLVSGGVLAWMAPELLSGKNNLVTEKVKSTIK